MIFGIQLSMKCLTFYRLIITGIDGQVDTRLICGIIAVEEKGRHARVDKVHNLAESTSRSFTYTMSVDLLLSLVSVTLGYNVLQMNSFSKPCSLFG